jgi:hypothetical protein
MITMPRRVLALSTMLLLSVPCVACGGGAISVLHAKGKPSGDGPARVDVLNSSGTGIHRLYVAKTETVNKARAAGIQPGSAEDSALWGDDQLGNQGLVEKHTLTITLPEGERYDVLVTDKDNREQLVKGLRVKAGGKYVLEIGDAWAQAR